MAVRLPPMQALRAFEAAARTGSLTRAAAMLNLTHGAISHQIKALEADLGVTLFERAGRGIRLTDEGERFAARVRAAFAELATGVQELAARTNPRLLRVSVIPSFAARWLLPRIGRFVAANPDIDLDVRANMANVDFRRDDDDVAIRYGLGSWPDVTSEHLLDDAFVPVCSPRIAGGVPRRPVGSRALHVAQERRRAVVALVPGGEAPAPRAGAGTHLQRLVAPAAGRGGRAGHRARAHVAARQRRAQWSARAPVRRGRAGAAQLLARVSRTHGRLAQARGFPHLAARRDRERMRVPVPHRGRARARPRRRRAPLKPRYSEQGAARNLRCRCAAGARRLTLSNGPPSCGKVAVAGVFLFTMRFLHEPRREPRWTRATCAIRRCIATPSRS